MTEQSTACLEHGFSQPCVLCFSTKEESQLGPELRRTQTERDALLLTLSQVAAQRDQYAERLSSVSKVMAEDKNIGEKLKFIVNPRAPLAFEAQCAAMRKALIAQLQNSEHMQSVLSNTMGMDVTQGPLQDEARVLRQALDGTAGEKVLERLVTLKGCLLGLVEACNTEEPLEGSTAWEQARRALAEDDV